MEYVNVEPTTEGYGNILLMFVQNIISDVPNKRVASDTKIMQQIVVLSAYLGQKDPEQLKKVERWLTGVGG